MIRGPRVHAVAAAVALLCGCIAIADFGGYDTTRAPDEGGAPEPGATLSIASVAPIVVRRGKSVTFAITVDRGSERAPIDVEMSSLPAGVTVARAVVPGGTGAATTMLTLVTTSEAALGAFTAVVRASATVGSASATSSVSVGVRSTQLDPSFGEGGVVVGTIGEGYTDFACAADGTSFVAVGASQDGDPQMHRRIRVHRLAASGAVDTFLDRSDAIAEHRIRVSPLGELVMTITTQTAGTVEGYSLASGQLSWTATLDPLTTGAVPRLVIATDGTIFVVSSVTGADGLGDVYVRRLNAAGADPGVGAGAIRLPRSATTSNESGAGALTAGGFVVCTSRTHDRVGKSELVLRRMTEDGGTDETFADGGELTVASPNGAASCVDLVVDDTRLIAYANLALVSGASSRPALVAIRNDGRLDPSFGSSGVARQAAPGSNAQALAAAPGGAGPIYTVGSDGTSALVFASLGDGSPDLSLGTGDAGIFPITVGDSPSVHAAHVLPDGRLLVAGMIQVGSASRWFVARYLP
jgi:hypothetical protein